MAYQMYVSLQGDNRIMRFLMNPDTGALESVGAVEVSGGPAPMTFNPTNTTLYVGRRDGLELTSYDIDQQTGDLLETGSVGLREAVFSKPSDLLEYPIGELSWMSSR